MDTFGRLPNELLDRIKYFYDEPITLSVLDNETLKKLQNKKKLELEQVELEIEKRALRTTRLLFNEEEKEVLIVRNDVYVKRHQITDFFIERYNDIKISWGTNKNVIIISCVKFSWNGSYFDIEKNKNKLSLQIEKMFEN